MVSTELITTYKVCVFTGPLSAAAIHFNGFTFFSQFSAPSRWLGNYRSWFQCSPSALFKEGVFYEISCLLGENWHLFLKRKIWAERTEVRYQVVNQKRRTINAKSHLKPWYYLQELLFLIVLRFYCCTLPVPDSVIWDLRQDYSWLIFKLQLFFGRKCYPEWKNNE